MLEHVVVVTDGLDVDGGTAKVALESAVALAESGLKVTVFAAYGRASAALAGTANLDVICTDQGMALNASNRLGGALRCVWNRPAHARMTQLLATLDPARTVVHVHCWTKALSASVIAAVVNAGFPSVMTLHEYFTACPTGCLYLHRDKAVCTLVPMSLACITKDCDSRSYAFKLFRVLRQAVQRTFGRVPNGIRDYIAVSEFTRRQMDRFLPPSRRIRTIGNPVAAVRDTRVAAEDSNTFVFVGRLSPEKGGVLLAEAARNAGADVLFIGDGPEREAILRVNPQARFTGWLDAAGVSEALRGARAVVMPSLWYETFGLVVLEAAALGIPAIVPDGTAACDLVSDRNTGLVFARGDAASLADQLRACTDDSLIERMSRAAYDAFWQNPPTMGAHVDRLLGAYRDVLASKAPVAAAQTTVAVTSA